MAASQGAMDRAARVNEIGFPEFTTKLISDVFDALIAADIRQQQAFIELVEATSKTLISFINDTKDDIGPAEVMQWLSKVLPPDVQNATAPPSKVALGTKLSAPEAAALNKALEIPGVEGGNQVATEETLKDGTYKALLDAAAKRIAANKYDMFQQMVKMGMVRLVVDNGVIETRLNFRAFESDYFTSHSSSVSRSQFDFRAKAKTGGLLSSWVQASASTAYTSMQVSTSASSSTSSSSVEVEIMGGVRINFHTDYQPLNPK
ncbi:hypothetical protein AAGW05_16555 [Arthrobacter sp. LAPM80]|uniref:hypothetical protein n=1 Tax=Arthrobacter sp. LAPM80 TaxID=3141788 RepID=UPI00398A8344